jgi:hypothetical protein
LHAVMPDLEQSNLSLVLYASRFPVAP